MPYLLARDTVHGAEGSVVIKRNGQNYVIAGMRNIRANSELQSEDMPVIGTRIIQDKRKGVKLTGTGNIYYGDDMFREMVRNYINTGVLEEFDIQITDSDPTTSIGTQVSAYYGCHLTGTIPLSILDDESSMLNYDFNWAYTRTAQLQSFTAPSQLGS